nr:hypothetical protein [uncultured Carboxylicivirga sp.]
MIDKYKTKNIDFLSLKNLIWIVVAQVAIIFLLPGGGVWWFDNIADNSTTYNMVMYAIETLFVVLLFTFSSIIKKDYQKTGILSLLAIFNFGGVFYLKTHDLIPNNIIAWFHPVTLSLFFSFIIYGDWKKALMGYFFGLFFSLAPLMGSLVPILFFHLWANSHLNHQAQKKASAFISRMYMYYIIMLILPYCRCRSLIIWHSRHV